MPALVPRPVYGSDTPEVHDFYARLKAGLALTLDGEAKVRREFLAEASALEPEIEQAMPPVDVARAVMEEAQARLAAVNAQPTPRKGLRSLQQAAHDAAHNHAEAEAVLTALRDRKGRALREVELREGAIRPRNPWQFGNRAVGPAKFGVYAFYDYDGWAMYVGKTVEGVSVRVGRHLTNQRTDAVGMSVLDPLEVVEVEVWPLWPNKENLNDLATARGYVDGLEFTVEQRCVELGSSLFNEKRIAEVPNPPALPASVRFDVLSAEYRKRLGHPDLRIARRLAVSARLGSRIAERSLRTTGLRQSLQKQLDRLQDLAKARFLELGGEEAVLVDDGREEGDEDEL